MVTTEIDDVRTDRIFTVTTGFQLSDYNHITYENLKELESMGAIEKVSPNNIHEVRLK